MSEAASSSRLPRVEQTDIHLVVIDELLDHTRGERWKDFAESNPELAREVLIEASRLAREGKSHEQIAIDIVTFASSALQKALERISKKSEETTGPSDDVGDLQPLGE